MATDAPASRTLDDDQWCGTLDDEEEEEKEDDEETEDDDEEVRSRNGSVAGASASSAPGGHGSWKAAPRLFSRWAHSHVPTPIMPPPPIPTPQTSAVVNIGA